MADRRAARRRYSVPLVMWVEAASPEEAHELASDAMTRLTGIGQHDPALSGRASNFFVGPVEKVHA